MKASTRMLTRRLLCMLLGGAFVVSVAAGGCGPSSDAPKEVSPEAKKALLTAKGADLSQYPKQRSTGKKKH